MLTWIYNFRSQKNQEPPSWSTSTLMLCVTWRWTWQVLENRVWPLRVITCAYPAPQSCQRGHASLLRDCSASRTSGSPLNSTCSLSSNKPNSRSIQSKSSDLLSHWFYLTLNELKLISRFSQSNCIITWSWDIDSWVLHEIRLNFYLGFTFCFTHFMTV